MVEYWYLGFFIKAITGLLLAYIAIKLTINAKNDKFPKFLKGKNLGFFIIFSPAVFLALTGFFMQIGTYSDELMQQGEKPEWAKSFEKSDKEKDSGDLKEAVERLEKVLPF